MREMAHRKMESANTVMVLNRKKRTGKIIDMLREGPVAKKKKVETHSHKELRLIDSRRVETHRFIVGDALNCNCFVLVFCFVILVEMCS